MSKSIKMSDDVYLRIRRLQGPRETYSEVMTRVLNVYVTVQGIREGLPAGHYLQERPKQEVK